MKFTFSWLCDHLDTNKSLNEICDALPMLGLEVEDLYNPLDTLDRKSTRLNSSHT